MNPFSISQLINFDVRTNFEDNSEKNGKNRYVVVVFFAKLSSFFGSQDIAKFHTPE